MYLSTEALLILTGGLAVIFFLALLVLLSSARKERSKNILLNARIQTLSEEIHTSDQTHERLRQERNRLHEEKSQLAVRLAALQTSQEEKDKKISAQNILLEETREAMEKNFQILADRIFTEKGAHLTRQHQDELNKLLQPVREQLGEFKKKVEDVYDRESRDHVSLVKEIEHLKTLNQQISTDALNLTNALKGQAKVQGLWGEMVLEHLLENSGLKQGHEFEVQVSLKDKNGQSRMPDVLVRLPGKREIVIDSKVSLKAYEKACRSDGPDTVKSFMQQHIDSIRQHIRSLSDKQYHLLEGINSLDFTILFIPAEGAFQSAISREPELLNTAMRKNIILTSPSTLMAILRTVHHLWRQEEQTRNSLAIAKQAGNLYDKCMGFLESFEEIGNRLDQAHSAWGVARSRLVTGRGNLVGRAQALKELGVQSSKSLPASIRRGDDTANEHYNTGRLP